MNVILYHDPQKWCKSCNIHNPNSKPLNYKGKYYANNEYKDFVEKNKVVWMERIM